MAGAAIYQRLTGPTYPFRGEVQVADESFRYQLVRSQETTDSARVAMPRPAADLGAVLSYRRYPTDDPFTTRPMAVEDVGEAPELVAYLPIQPAAGKIEYRIELTTAEGNVSIPALPGETIILRYKDPVPIALLFAHVIAMFFTVLVGMRAGLGAVFEQRSVRPLAWVTLIGMTVGGLVFGPFVQKYAFGDYWTGFPLGYDLTDNKLLVMWLVWLVACSVLGTGRRARAGGAKWLSPVSRTAVVLAAVAMMVVYLIPHSMQGSELDYGAIDAGIAPKEAVGTGRN